MREPVNVPNGRYTCTTALAILKELRESITVGSLKVTDTLGTRLDREL